MKVVGCESLRSCPLCFERAAVVHKVGTGYIVKCSRCEYKSPVCNSRSEAVRTWSDMACLKEVGLNG